MTVRLFSNFRNFLPHHAEGDNVVLHPPDETDVKGILGILHIPAGMPRVITVNDENCGEGHILKEGDIVKVFPVAMGG